MFFNWRSPAGLVASAAGLVVLVSTLAALPVAAAKGDIWTQPAGTPEETAGHSQEVHLPCGAVDIWGDELDQTAGGWVLYHLPPPNPPGPGTQVAEGTYKYVSKGVIATIPLATFLQSSGPHFKIEVDNDNNKSKTFWLDCAVGISTTTNPANAVIGATLKDSATLTNGFSPTGTITFTLVNPSNTVVHTETVSVSGNGTYSTPTGHVADAVGTWHWQAAYSGDGGNGTAVSQLADEPVVVAKASPAISTTTDPASANVGSTLKDGATLSGGYSPTGTITFTLRNPADVVVDTETVSVSGNGTYSTPVGFVASGAGTWHWAAAYSGDASNNAVASDPASEPVVVSASELAQPVLTTTPNPGSAVVGTTLKDSATLSGGNSPTGTITFTLLNPSNTVVHTETVSVSGNGTYATPVGHATGIVGTWHWSAQYSGDSQNKPATSAPDSEPVIVTEGENERVQPDITTTPSPSTATVGTTVKDGATLSGGNNPTGTIHFTLYDPSATAVHTEDVTVAGNGSYSTPTGHVVGTQGTWHWKAEYSGDANNLPVSSDPSDEPVVVGAGGGVLAATGMTAPAQGLAAGLMAFGLLAILTAFAWKRRTA